MDGSVELRLAVLIDADNAPRSAIKDVMAEVAVHGTPTIKRIYGDWTSPNMSTWKPLLLENAISPVQQYAYTTGKNSTDSAMIIDAMDILYSGKVDGFVLVSSDSDFTRLATRLREAGMKVLGIGERTGNTPLEAMVIEYAQLRGTLDGMDPTVIREIADYYEAELGYQIPANTPFVGRDFNMTQAGIHADGLLKDEEIYNIFDTTTILKSPPKVSITQTSGAAGLAMWLTGYLGCKEHPVDKDDPRVVRLKEWVDEQYDKGRVTIIGNAELEQVCKTLGITA